MKNREVIERILKYHPQFPENYHGCDDYKAGDPEAECTGVITALTPNIHVIREAIAHHANLIVVHEPTYYTSKDPAGWEEDFDNEVYRQKLKLIEDHGICIWRDHDHMHAHQPDSIFTGVLKYLGWEDQAETDADTGLFGHWIVTLPEMTVRELAEYLMEKIGLHGARIVGNPESRITRAAFVGHLYPMEYHTRDGRTGEYSVKVIETLEQKADVIIPGEVIDWTVLSYIRDASELGLNKAAINIGHFNWEELGMRYMKDWLSELVTEVPVTYIPSGDMYTYLSKETER